MKKFLLIIVICFVFLSIGGCNRSEDLNARTVIHKYYNSRFFVLDEDEIQYKGYKDGKYEYYIFYDEEIDPELYFDESIEEIGSIMFSETLFVEKEDDFYNIYSEDGEEVFSYPSEALK